MIPGNCGRSVIVCALYGKYVRHRLFQISAFTRTSFLALSSLFNEYARHLQFTQASHCTCFTWRARTYECMPCLRPFIGQDKPKQCRSVASLSRVVLTSMRSSFSVYRTVIVADLPDQVAVPAGKSLLRRSQQHCLLSQSQL